MKTISLSKLARRYSSSTARLTQCAAFAAALLSGHSAHATNLFWDGGVTDVPGSGDGASAGGSGDWSTSIANWDGGANHVAWPSTGTDNDAIFGGAAGIVILQTPIVANDITFNTTGYTVAGSVANPLTLNGATSNITTPEGVTATIGSVIDGFDTILNKAGTGTLTLTGANLYGGATTISSGTLRIGSSSALGTQVGEADGTTILPGATLDLGGVSNGPLASVGAEMITVSGAGVGGNGAIVSSSPIATPFVGVRFLTLAGDTTLGFTNRWDIGSNTGANFSSLVGGGHTLNLIGSGAGQVSLNFLGETDLGNININLGSAPTSIAYLQGSTTLGRAEKAVTISGGSALNIFTSSTVSNFDKKFVLDNGTITVQRTGGATLDGTISLTNASTIGAVTTTTASNIISGSGSLTKTGAGTLILPVANTYTGGTTVTTGALQASEGIGLPSGTFLSLNGGVFQSDGAATFTRALGTSGNTFSLSANGGGFSANGGQMTVNIGGASAEQVWDTTEGTHLVGILKFGSTTANDLTVFQNGIDLNAATRTINVTAGTGGDAAEIASVIRTSSGIAGLAKTGNGTLILSRANTYNGETVLSGGVLVVGHPNALGDLSAGTIQSGASELRLTGGIITAAEPLTINAGGITNLGALRNFSGDNTYSGTITLATQARINSDDGTLTLDAPTAVVSTGRTLVVGGFGDTIISGIVALTGAGGVAKDGPGTLTLSGANTYTGATTVGNGTLLLSGERTAQSGGITVGNAAAQTGTLRITNGTYTVGGTFIVGQGTNSTSGVVNQSGGNITLTGTQLILGNGGTPTADPGGNSLGFYNLSGGTLTGAAAATRGIILGTNTATTGIFTLSDSGTLAMGSSALQVGRSDAAAVNSTGIFNQTGGSAAIGTLTIGGGLGATNAGTSGTLNITGGTFTASSFTRLSGGDTSVSQIIIGGSAQVTLPAFPTARGVGSAASITFDGGVLAPFAADPGYMGGLTNAFLTSNGATIDVPLDKDITIAQAFENAAGQIGQFKKNGAGALTLSGNSSYTGATTVNGGSLLVTGSLSGSSVTVNSTGTLGSGTGITGTTGPVVVNSGGTISPGLGLGALNTGDLTLKGGSTFKLEINSTESSTDLVTSSGALDLALSNDVVLAISDLSESAFTDGNLVFLTYNGTRTAGLFSYNNSVVNDDSLITVGSNNFFLDYNFNGNSVALRTIPEPGAALSLLGGIGMLAGLQRFRRRQR